MERGKRLLQRLIVCCSALRLHGIDKLAELMKLHFVQVTQFLYQVLCCYIHRTMYCFALVCHVYSLPIIVYGNKGSLGIQKYYNYGRNNRLDVYVLNLGHVCAGAELACRPLQAGRITSDAP